MNKGILTCVVAVLFCAESFAQTFGYGVDFEYFFDNKEYKTGNAGEYVFPSGTLHLVKLTPSVLLNLPAEKFDHRLSLGIDIYKNLGEGFANWDLFKEITFNYRADASFANGGRFSAIAGCYPRSFSEGEYPFYIFSTETIKTDLNFEGVFFKYRNDKIYAELGLDWMGMIGDKEHPERRERFQIISAGKWSFARMFFLGWSGRFYHFACSPNAPDNVVDNHTLTPILGFEAAGFKLTAGPAVSYQRDRKYQKNVDVPIGLHSEQSFQKWNAGIRNVFYYGEDLMPYYERYGSELYSGRTGYHTLLPGGSVYDQLDIFYEPHILDNLTLRLELEFHFGSPNDSYQIPVWRGWTQMLTVKYAFTGPKKK